MVGVALYFRFYIMYTCGYLHNVQKKESMRVDGRFSPIFN
jgi:hypothetical protein